MFKIFNNRMFLNLMTAFVGILVAIVVIFNTKTSTQPVVAIANWGLHASLLETISGITEELKNVRIELLDANFNSSLVMQNLYKLKSYKPKVMVTISTPVSQIAKNTIKDIPVIFANVTDPVAAGILVKKHKSFANITGVSDLPDFTLFLSLIKKLLPNAHTIGILYSAYEDNDAALVKMLKLAADSYDMNILAVSIEDSNDIAASVDSLKNKVDFIYVGTSSITQKSLSVIVNLADQFKIPVFNAHSRAVMDHMVLGSFGVNYRTIGHLVANAIKLILQGGSIKSIKPIYPSAPDHQIVISRKKANQYNIIIPQENNIFIIE